MNNSARVFFAMDLAGAKIPRRDALLHPQVGDGQVAYTPQPLSLDHPYGGRSVGAHTRLRP